MRVFVSSVIDGYEAYREAAKAAIEALGHEAVLMEVTHAASPYPSQRVCLAEVAGSNVVVVLVGRRYGAVQASGKSATHEEWNHACRHNKRVLLFVEDVDDVDEREERQKEFLAEVSGTWEEGRLRVRYAGSADLVAKTVKALKSLEEEVASVSASVPDAVEGLPPACRRHIESLRASSPVAGARLVALLSDAASRTAGVLSRLASEPPGWLTEAGSAAWEAISDFLDAHELPGSDSTRQMAIEAGSPRSSLYLIHQAVAAAEDGDRERSEEMLGRVPCDHPLASVARVCITGDAMAVVESVKRPGLHECEDADLALYAIVTLVRAYWRLDRFDMAVKTLNDASQRFPDRAGLLLHRAKFMAGHARQPLTAESDRTDLLGEAVDLAVRARDLMRVWNGPSYNAVAVATYALLGLGDAQRVVELSIAAPEGEATVAEADAPDVQRNLAHAQLMLGRYKDIDSLQVADLDDSERSLIQALQARGLGDAVAPARIRRAVAQACDEASLLKSLMGLAMFGEVDEAALSRVPPERAADVVLIRAMAAIYRDDHDEAIRLLVPYRLASLSHAECLANAQHQAGASDDAVETLMNAIRRLGAVSLYEAVVEILKERDRLEEAMAMASDGLAAVPSRAARHRLRVALVEIAGQLGDWPQRESQARALAREFPQDERAAWAVVEALLHQAKNQHAWGYLLAHDLNPYDEDTARLTVAVCGSVDAPEEAAGRLLEVAAMYTHSEEVSGAAILSLMVSGDRFSLSEEQRSQLNELSEDFFARYPQSDLLRRYAAEEPEDLLETMGSLTHSRAQEFASLVEKVRSGLWPYSMLRLARVLPYAELLLSLAAGCLTAIPSDSRQRDREREAARAALGGRIAVDTSVAALGIHAGLDLDRFSAAFARVLVAEELIADARAAVTSARLPIAGVVTHDPVLGRAVISTIDEQQREEALKMAERALGMLCSWQSVWAGPPIDRRPEGVADVLGPWDASVRVASSTGCALWCDDIALRSLAESHGIAAFGTWALHEALANALEHHGLPLVAEMKMRLLRAGIADVPISWPELMQAADDSDGPDIAVELFLRRPVVWGRDPSEAFRWYLERVETLLAASHKQRIPGLLYSATHGQGTVSDSSQRQNAMSAVLAATVWTVNDLQMVPALVAASRYAARELDPTENLDPLKGAVRQLLRGLESGTEPAMAALIVRSMFSLAEPEDQRIARSVVLEAR